MDFITKEGLSFMPKGEELEIWDEKQKKCEKIYTTKGKRFLRRHREQKKILSFKAKVRNKREHKVEEYMSKVSKEDMDFLHLLTYLRVKDMEKKAWVNIIQCMEGKCEVPTQKSSLGTAPSSTGAETQDAVPQMQDAMPANDKETPGGDSGIDGAVTHEDAVSQINDTTPSGNTEMPHQVRRKLCHPMPCHRMGVLCHNYNLRLHRPVRLC